MPLLCSALLLYPVSSSAGLNPLGMQQEQTLISPSPVLLCSLRIGTCFFIGGEDVCVWAEQGM